MTLRFFCLWMAIATLLFSCKTNPLDLAPVVREIRPATLPQKAAIPLPKSEIILTIDGKIQNTNQANKIVMDRQAIESLELIEYTIFDPYEKETSTFQGVLLSDLVTLWQISPDATELEITALNDYRVTIPIKIIEQIPILFALKQNDEYMQRSYRGPAMLVVPPADIDLTFPRETYWIWQISKVTVK